MLRVRGSYSMSVFRSNYLGNGMFSIVDLN